MLLVEVVLQVDESQYFEDKWMSALTTVVVKLTGGVVASG